MAILLAVLFFLIGLAFRDILNYIYNLNKKIRQADEILAEERKRKSFRNKYDFSDSFEDNEIKNDKE